MISMLEIIETLWKLFLKKLEEVFFLAIKIFDYLSERIEITKLRLNVE